MHMYIHTPCSAGMGFSQMMWSWLHSWHLKSGCSRTCAELDTSIGWQQGSVLDLRQSWILCEFCSDLLSPLWVQCHRWRLRVQLMVSPVSVHIELQIPASEWGGLQGRENEDFNKNIGFTVFSPDRLIIPCVCSGKRHKSYLAVFLQGEKNM